MLKIWGRTTSSNVQKVLWCCAELGIRIRPHRLGRAVRPANRDPEYLRLNPNGLVPTVITAIWSCGNPTRSAAICARPATATASTRATPPPAHPCRALDGLATRGDRGADGCCCCRGWSAPSRRSATPGGSRRRRRRAIVAWTIVDGRPGRAGPYLGGDHLFARRDRARHAPSTAGSNYPIERPGNAESCAPGTKACLARAGVQGPLS